MLQEHHHGVLGVSEAIVHAESVETVSLCAVVVDLVARASEETFKAVEGLFAGVEDAILLILLQ